MKSETDSVHRGQGEIGERGASLGWQEAGLRTKELQMQGLSWVISR